MYCVIYLLRIIIGRFWYLSFVKPGITCLKAKKLLVINLLNLFQIMTSVLKILIHVVWLAGFVKTRQDHFDAVVNLGSSETDTIVKVCQYVTGIYHINYGVIQGFLTFRKAVKAHVKNIEFFTCVWYCQSAADTSLAFRASRSGWWKNGEAFAILQTVTFKLS